MVVSNTVIDMESTGRLIKSYAEEQGYSVKDIQKYLRLAYYRFLTA